MLKRSALAVGTIAAAAAAAISVGQWSMRASQDAALVIRPIPSPAPAGSAQPQLTVSDKGRAS